ncbi:CBS domain-containing protein [Sphingorhabdus pulchriflava]|uniref:CBS domain-containing protein n=1 Tax=Sphingorhabdus pulchriflava TaxID=2292257 RepID=A0A371B691_9SPHN|nr:CBS domain-containing protein [Sphingorhabdus pulchriflava]RDV02963.1 CBS domain-containing protein [Sphingorhabdus pulchriflava]
MTIATILQSRTGAVFTASADELVEQVTARLAEQRIGALPVVDGQRVIGIFSERDVIYGLALHGSGMLQKKVSEVMTAPAITVTADTPVLSALSLMSRRRIRHLPVVDDGRISGFVSIGDLVKYRIEKIEAEASAMRDYIQMA